MVILMLLIVTSLIIPDMYIIEKCLNITFMKELVRDMTADIHTKC